MLQENWGGEDEVEKGGEEKSKILPSLPKFQRSGGDGERDPMPD